MRKIFLLGTLASAVWIAACQDTSGPGGPGGSGDTEMVLTLTPSSVVLEGGDRVRLIAKVKAGIGPEVTRTDVTWFSSDESVATVEAGGLVRGVAPGQARIVASLRGASALARITVTSKPGKKTLEQPACAALRSGAGIPSACP